MTIEQRKKLAAHLHRLLKVRRISFPIAITEKGPLSINYIKDAPDFEIVLDAVPLNMNDYDNRELKSLLEKYLFEKEEKEFVSATKEDLAGLPIEVQLAAATVEKAIESVEPEKKKSGRPAKSK